MSDLLLTLWPLFALILIGLALRRTGFPGNAFWPAAERLNYFILFPALLFANLAEAPLDDPALLRLALAILAVLGVAWLALLLSRRLRGWPAARFGPLAQGILRFNTYLALAIVASLYGPAGLGVAAVIIAVLTPAVNVLSVLSLMVDHGARPRDLLRRLGTNPLILACLGGIAVAFLEIGLPFGTGRLLGLLAAASLPLGLLSVGAALRLDAMRAETPTLLANSALRLVAMPVLALGIGALFALPALETALLVLFFALPTAPNSYVLTRQLNGDADLMAGLVTLQTLLAALTLPLVLAVHGAFQPMSVLMK